MFILYAYDVSAKRTQKFKKTIGKFLGHRQNSFFYGHLSPAELLKLRAEISSLMIPGDRVVEVSAENSHNVSIEEWKKAEGTGPAAKKEDDLHKRKFEVL